MMGWWLDRYLEVHTGEVAASSMNLATALVFDRAGVTPGLRAPMEVLLLGDLMLQGDIDDLLTALLGPDGFTPYDDTRWKRQGFMRWKPPRGRPLVGLPYFYSAKMPLDARHLARGIPLFLATPNADEVVPQRALAAARVLTVVLDDELIREFARVRYGDGDFEVPEGVMGTHDVILAAEVATTLRDFERVLGDITGVTERVRLEILEKEREREREEADAQTKAAVERAERPVRQVRRLSEMRGFGEARDWGLQLARDLTAYRQGEIPWEDVDKGILMSGAPGTGKTTFARALAQEVDAHFVSLSYTDLEEHYVIKAMRKKFEEWRKLATKRPVVVFFDEIDSFGVRGGNGHNDGYWSSLINALLDFLDGVHPRDGIVFIGATNFVNRVDPALLRPGRLDRHVVIPMPSEEDLAAIVAHHLDVDVNAAETKSAARELRGSSPAAVAQFCREARRMGRLFGRKADAGDLADVVALSRPPVHPRRDLQVRVHEAGHAVAGLASEAFGWTLQHVEARRVAEWADGTTVSGQVEIRTPQWCMTRPEIIREIAHALSGRVAEEVVLGEVSSGSRGDLRAATAMAATMVRHEGLGSSLVYVSGESMATDRQVEEIEAILAEAYALARSIVWPWRVRALAEILVEKRSMTGAEVREALRRYHADRFFAERDDDRAWDEMPMAA